MEPVVAFRILPQIEGELPFVTVGVGTILMIDNLKSKGVRYLVAISEQELTAEITAASARVDSWTTIQD